jgi:hypothetical protein
MDLPIRCRCGHAIPDHASHCRVSDCSCKRDRFDALESALDIVAEHRSTRPDVHRLRLRLARTEPVEA